MFRFSLPTMAFGEVGHEEVGGFACEELAQERADHQRGSETRANRSRLQIKEVRIDGSESDGGHDVDECPAPGVIPNWKQY